MLAIQVSGTRSVRLGNPIRLLCNVTGSRARSRDVGWYRGRSALRSDEREGVTVSRRHGDEGRRSTEVRLTIAASRARDAGEYTCRTTSRRLEASIVVDVTTDDGTTLTLVCVLLLVHGQVTIIFVVSVCLFVCLFVQSFSQPFLTRFRSN